MTNLVLFILIFAFVGCAFLLVNMLIGKLVRPNHPTVAKGEIYECGEEAVGSAWVQFDLRFYVVALLFVIFDVEMAFFFPWAVVFGTSNRLADANASVEVRAELAKSLDAGAASASDPQLAHRIAVFSFVEFLAFFAVLLVGFAYLWKRGDLDWVRSTAGQDSHTVTEQQFSPTDGPDRA